MFLPVFHAFLRVGFPDLGNLATSIFNHSLVQLRTERPTQDVTPLWHAQVLGPWCSRRGNLVEMQAPADAGDCAATVTPGPAATQPRRWTGPSGILRAGTDASHPNTAQWLAELQAGPTPVSRLTSGYLTC